MKLETIKIDSVEISYYQKGEGDLVLFLHGGGMPSVLYRDVVDKISQTKRVIVPDIPGFGKSSVPDRSWDLDDYGDIFECFLDSLDLREVEVIGHSLGGGIGLVLASRSKRINKLTLYNPVGIKTSYGGRGLAGRLIWKSIRSLIFLRQRKIGILIIWSFWREFFGKFSSVPVVWESMKKSVLMPSIDFAKINQEVVLIWGEDDELFSLEHAAELNRQLKNSSLIVEKGNHDWVLYRGERDCWKV